MKTKIIALMLVLVLALGVFASCGNKNNGNSGNNGGDIIDPLKPSESNGRPWETTTLNFQMTENSNYQELPSTCKRYLAGDITGVEDVGMIDDMVAERNAAAYADANVKINYSYLPDTSDYSWAKNIDTIYEEVSGKAAGRPDIYCNFVYDMVATSLKGSFANLLSTTMYPDGHELAGAEHNYFGFADPFFQDTGKDYMYEYMRSLTLSKYKMYCLSSDYFTDMVRAFLIVPVNISLLESIKMSDNAGEFNSDRDGDGDFDIDDFYQLVRDKEWNYETLAKYSEYIYDGSSENITDQGAIWGFALATQSGLSAAGMIYTSSIVIIDRELNVETSEYTYSYPYTEAISEGVYAPTGAHPELVAFCDNLTALFRSRGVIAIGPTENGTGREVSGNGLQVIRDKFATNNILFGGCICLGSLEYDQYREMNGDGKKGYGVVPVPLYRTNYTDAQVNTQIDDYLTQIHNIGRVGGISFTTEKFAQCTAFLDYQSLHSADILNEYYDYKLQYDIANGDTNTVEMLQYIRKNVRSSFDKAYEDALGRFYSSVDPTSMADMWHSMIKNNGYQFTGADMTQKYTSVVAKKANQLWALEYRTFPTLPN